MYRSVAYKNYNSDTIAEQVRNGESGAYECLTVIQRVKREVSSYHTLKSS